MNHRHLLWQEMGPVESLSFDLEARAESDQAGFVEYLRGANLEIVSTSGAGPMRGAMTRFPDITFAHVEVAPGIVDWPRDQLSWQRASVVVCLAGSVEAVSEGPVWRREPGLILVPPGDTPVRFTLTGEPVEVFYLSLPAGMITELNLPERPVQGAEPVTTEALRPLRAFIGALASATIPADTAAGPMHGAATEVARSLVRLISDGENREISVYSRAMKLIMRSYQDAALSGRLLAKWLGVSERTLQAAFAAEHTTVNREIRGHRARAAVAIRRGNPRMPTADLARATGFGSVSSLFRALREADADAELDDGAVAQSAARDPGRKAR
ncbi:hypothetical protein RZO50_02760 [Microbacterium sp. SSW1-59]|uniref:helix-turn-helix domain-containing protein n=1 Tax=Microbacterium xanthum TaxID=3079794 RepID=UPI002AD22146|nr:helix-turn-helix domain-containing protein [Microbacterium sp. SSW1-59]MDZ8200418.1 hypothetical protein [Microbacterium sp. SSW1-59]